LSPLIALWLSILIEPDLFSLILRKLIYEPALTVVATVAVCRARYS